MGIHLEVGVGIMSQEILPASPRNTDLDDNVET